MKMMIPANIWAESQTGSVLFIAISEKKKKKPSGLERKRRKNKRAAPDAAERPKGVGGGFFCEAKAILFAEF